MQSFLWTTKFLEGLTQVRQVALSPIFFEVAGYNCGQMRAQKWFRLTDPILVPSLYLGTEIGSAGRTLNRPLQKARFTFQALLEFDRRVWMDRLTVYIHDLGQVDACIVAVARLVSLWRDTCNYSITGRHLLLTIRCAWNMPLPASSPVPPLAKTVTHFKHQNGF